MRLHPLLANLEEWIGGTANQIIVTGAGEGLVTLSTPQDIHTGAAPAFAGLTIGDGGVTNYLNINSTGDLLFFGSGGLAFGEIYAYDSNTEITISSSGLANKVQITVFDANGSSNGTTPDHTNDHITIATAGKYLVLCSIVISSAGAVPVTIGHIIAKNNGATNLTDLHAHRSLSGGGGDTGSVSISGIADFAANDTVELWIYNETNTDNVIVDDVNLSLVQVGG